MTQGGFVTETETAIVPGQGQPAAVGNLPMITYVLYLVGLLVGPATIVGLVLAYTAKGEAPAWVQTHYRWLIRTFWIGLLFAVIGIATTVLMVGYLLLLISAIWYIVRVIRGFVAFQAGKPIANPASWAF